MNWCLKCGQERAQSGRCPVCGRLVLVNKMVQTKTSTDEPLLDKVGMERLLQAINDEPWPQSELLEEIHWGLDDLGD